MTRRYHWTNGKREEKPVRTGVVGVGHMGRHHARVYSELVGVSLEGVHDVDTSQARAVAEEFDSQALSFQELLDRVDAVSVAVPTQFHYDTVRKCLDSGVHVLVEKPFVTDHRRGRELIDRADEAGLVLQVGHIERFNPATEVLEDVVEDLDIVAVDIQRLGPPVERGGTDSVVMDLMIHDVDILLSLLGTGIESMSATAWDERYVTAQLQFDSGTIASVTASRLTQQKVRKLALTALSCRVTVDFISQTVEIHRRSLPEYVETNGDIRYRHESVVEQPTVENGEPLRAELQSFLNAIATDSEPVVSGEDALLALSVIQRLEDVALGTRAEVDAV